MLNHKPRLLDLFCGAGGAGMGYYRAGFKVVGVDINPQPSYPFEFHQADAMQYCHEHRKEFDAIHASPPCQAYSQMRPHNLHQTGKEFKYPELIDPTRRLLIESGKPFVIENVVTAPLSVTLILCGTMFGLKVFRHRWFESNILLMQLPHRKHNCKTAGKGKIPKDENTYWCITGRVGNHPNAQGAMGIDWMDRHTKEVAQAIPPAYTEYIGKQLMQYIERGCLVK